MSEITVEIKDGAEENDAPYAALRFLHTEETERNGIEYVNSKTICVTDDKGDKVL